MERTDVDLTFMLHESGRMHRASGGQCCEKVLHLHSGVPQSSLFQSLSGRSQGSGT